jgi:hypothetical protein
MVSMNLAPVFGIGETLGAEDTGHILATLPAAATGDEESKHKT